MNYTYISTTSTAQAFKKYTASSFSVSIPSQNIAVGGFVSYTATTAMDNAGSICQVQTYYDGLEAFWRVINGSSVTNFTNYQVLTYYYFSGTTLSVNTLISNQTGGTITIPAITVNCRAFLFLAPF